MYYNTKRIDHRVIDLPMTNEYCKTPIQTMYMLEYELIAVTMVQNHPKLKWYTLVTCVE